MNIGEKIRNTREDMDLSQEDVAGQIPMSQSGYSKIERGIQEPSLYQLKRICEILKILKERNLRNQVPFCIMDLQQNRDMNSCRSFLFEEVRWMKK